MKGILGRKLGMTEVFTKNGKLIPVTVVSIEPNVVTQVKTEEIDGYNAIQLGVFDKKEKNTTKAQMGHIKKANTTPKRFLKEIRNVEGVYNLGDTVKADIFAPGEFVDVTGTSKGKGFQGVIKRHNYSRGPETHGSRFHRRPGSLGPMRLMRVAKGKKLPGHMGAETITIQNLEIIEVNLDDNYILVSGNIPGAKNSFVLVKSAVKKTNGKSEELMDWNAKEETVVDEIVEETVENTEEAPAEEVVSEETTEEKVEETPAPEVTEEVVEEPAAEESIPEVKEETTPEEEPSTEEESKQGDSNE